MVFKHPTENPVPGFFGSIQVKDETVDSNDIETDGTCSSMVQILMWIT